MGQASQTRDNNSIEIETNIHPIQSPSNLCMSEIFPIYEDISNPTPQHTMMLPDKICDAASAATTSTRNSGKPNAHHLHNIIVESENNHKFDTSIVDENVEWDVVVCSRDRLETAPHKKLKVTNNPPGKKPPKKPRTKKNPKPPKKPKPTKKPKPPEKTN